MEQTLAHELAKELGCKWHPFRARALKLGWKKFGTMTKLNDEEIKALTTGWNQTTNPSLNDVPNKKYRENDPAKYFDDSEYGEAGIAILEHTQAMTQHERMISEAGFCVGGKVFMEHPSDDLLPFHQRVDVLARRIGRFCGEHKPAEIAAELMAYWDILDLPRPIRELYTQAIYKRGQEKDWDIIRAVIFFRSLALPLAEAEHVNEEDALEAVSDEDGGVSPNPTVNESHQIGIPTGQVDKDWVKSQNESFRALYNALLLCDHPKVLATLGQKAYHDLTLNGKQARVFWDLHKAKKAEFDARLAPDARAIIAQVRALTDYKHLLRAGKALFNFQTGASVLSIPKDQWANIWNAYHARKRLLQKQEAQASNNETGQLNLFDDPSRGGDK